MDKYACNLRIFKTLQHCCFLYLVESFGVHSVLQVRLGQILDNGKVETKKLGRHHGRVYKLAVLPGDPNVFYSCGEDGFVQHVGLYYLLCSIVFLMSGFWMSFRFLKTQSSEPVFVFFWAV